MNYLLAYPLFDEAAVLEENKVLQIIVEHPKAFYALLQDIFLSINNEQSNFLLTKNLETINLHKRAELLLDYLNIMANEKSVLTKLYTALSTAAEESQFVGGKTQIEAAIYAFVQELSNALDISIDFSPLVDFKLILKSIDIKIDQSFTDTLSEKIINFVKANLLLLKKDIFIFVNIKSFVSEEDLKQLYKYMFYNKLIVIDIESAERSRLGLEKTIIIDNDLCQIT